MGKTASIIRTSHFNEMQPGNCNNLTVVQGKGGHFVEMQPGDNCNHPTVVYGKGDSTRVPFPAALSYNSLEFKRQGNEDYRVTIAIAD